MSDPRPAPRRGDSSAASNAGLANHRRQSAGETPAEKAGKKAALPGSLRGPGARRKHNAQDAANRPHGRKDETTRTRNSTLPVRSPQWSHPPPYVNTSQAGAPDSPQAGDIPPELPPRPSREMIPQGSPLNDLQKHSAGFLGGLFGIAQQQLGQKITDSFDTTQDLNGLASPEADWSPDVTGFDTGAAWQSPFDRKNSDDLTDVAAKRRGVSGVCSKCRQLPLQSLGTDDTTVTSGSSLEWATPLSRVLYHADWCRMCKLMLSMLCLPANDPLQHPAIAPHVPENISGITMQDWVGRGWKFNDQCWPFGHGDNRHEGAAYALGPGRQAIGGILVHQGTAAMAHGFDHPIIPDAVRQAIHPSSHMRNAKKHPLSCVIQCTVDSPDGLSAPGVLFCNVLGYSRKLGADLDLLSSFRLRAVPTSDHISASIPLSSDHFSYGRLIDRHWIDPAFGRDCLSACEALHASQCGQMGWETAIPKPTFLRCIDVDDLCIAQIARPEDCRYLALSYVWGKASMVKLQHSNIQELMRPQGLLHFRDRLPQTVIDAMEVVKSMGERYLWTDALCILQEDTEETAQQIGCMDRVYGNALATIVAARGRHANAGLRGIRQRSLPQLDRGSNQKRNISQMSARLDDGSTVIAPLSRDNELDSSAWNSRAWCYQEQALSRRLIIFANGQMTWYCRKMTCREDMPVKDSAMSLAPLQWLSLEKQHLGLDTQNHWVDGSIEVDRHSMTKIVRSASFVEFSRAIEQYTSRKLSFPGDILRAFAGLSQIFSACFKSRLLYGLPESVFDVVLLWRPLQRLQRRPGFPSWSWAGWIGHLGYGPTYRAKFAPAGPVTSFRWLDADEPGGEEGVRPVVRWSVWDEERHQARLLNETGVGFLAAGPDLPREWENAPCYRSDNGQIGVNPAPAVPSIDHPLPSYALVFWTACTQDLNIGAEIRKGDHQVPQAKQNQPQRYELLDDEASIVGNILMDGAEDLWALKSSLSFIEIGETQCLNLEDEGQVIEGYPAYLIMAVDWDRQRQTTQRVGIGRICKSAWKTAIPRLELICLV